MSARVDETQVAEIMRQVIDPELNIDVVSLGMVGPIEVNGGNVRVSMRLTSMSCPFWDLFVEQVRGAVATVDGVDHVEVRFDRTQPWSPELMSDAARAELEEFGLMPPSVRVPRAGASREQLLQIVRRTLGD